MLRYKIWSGSMSLTKSSKRPKAKNKKTKHILVFDEKARAEYLQGFRKRKLERKKYAKEKLALKLKEERKELKKQERELLKARSLHQPLVPEVDHLVNSTEYDLPEHTVTITDISEVDFTGEGGVRLGQNRADEDHTDVRKILEQPETEDFKKMAQKYKQIMAHVNKLENQSMKKKLSMKSRANRKKRKEKLRIKNKKNKK